MKDIELLLNELPNDGTVEATIDLGTFPLGYVLFDGSKIWMARLGTAVFKVRVSDCTILGTYANRRSSANCQARAKGKRPAFPSGRFLPSRERASQLQ